MLKYQTKLVDPRQNILYGSTQHEEFVPFSYDPEKSYPVRVELVGITHPDRNYFIERKHNDYFVFEYVIRGKGYIVQGDKRYDVEADCVYILQPGSAHKYGAEKRIRTKRSGSTFSAGSSSTCSPLTGCLTRSCFPIRDAKSILISCWSLHSTTKTATKCISNTRKSSSGSC